MTKRIQVTRRSRAVRSTSRTARKVETKSVADSLGAEPLDFDLERSASLALLLALRSTLRSSGGRPSLEGTERRQKIPMTDADWHELEKIAQSFQANGLNATAGQIAGQLLRDAIARLEASPLSYPMPPPARSMRLSESLAVKGRVAKRPTRRRK